MQRSKLLWKNVQIYQCLCHISKENSGGNAPYYLISLFLFHSVLIVQHSLWVHSWRRGVKHSLWVHSWRSLILEDFQIG